MDAYNYGLKYLQNWLQTSPNLESEFEDLYNIKKEHKRKTSQIKNKNLNKKGNTQKIMSPISEKRSPPIIKENAKENISNTKTIYENKNVAGPEIFDFRDSWLQEIEMYKDHIKSQQMLTQHNHLHTTTGCLTDTSKDNVKPAEPLKRRLRTRSDSDPNNPNSNATKKEREEELVLKRAREESYTPNYSPDALRRNKAKSETPITSKTLLQPPEKKKTQLSSAQSNGPVFLTGVSKGMRGVKSRLSPAREKAGYDRRSGLDAALFKNKLTVDSKQPLPNLLNDIANTPTSSDSGITNLEDKSEDGSRIDDDEDDFADIDNAEYDDTSSDSDDEYIGCPYFLDSDEELDSFHCIDNSHATANARYVTPKCPFTPSLFASVPPYITFASHVEKGPTLPPELQKILKWKLTNVMPRIVRRVVGNTGFRLIKKTNDWMGTWEKHMKSPLFKTIRTHQKFNHLPGSFKIGRKDSVWRNLRGYISKHGKKEFGFMQKTFILPQELQPLKKAWPCYSKKNVKWIIKPPASARGAGIKVVNKWGDIPKDRPIIVQKYIERPLLINGSKFDLRLYVFITSINPLRIFLHTDGLARFASVQYSNKFDTLDDRCMHLTNYSINKFSSNYSKNEDINACQGHKWTLKALWSYFKQRGINTKRLWSTLRSLVIKTVISGEGCLNRMFKGNVRSKYNCYEMFGFDVLLDENLVPWLLEVNISPSLHSDLPLDLHVKGPLIQACLNTALYQIPPKLTVEQQKYICKEFHLEGPLCFDPKLYTTCLTLEELRKHNFFTHKNMEYREEYLEAILEDLTPDDVRCLIVAEDELNRCPPLERIFPGPESHVFLKYIEGPRYYNRLLDAWETKYSKHRTKGIALLRKLCKAGYHLKVPETAVKRVQEYVEQEMLGGAESDTQILDQIAPEQDNNDAVSVSKTLCSQQASIPQKHINGEVFPIAVETK